MDRIDEQVQQALTTAAGSPVMAERDALLASLTARIERGGADVAAAPAVPAPLEPVGEPASDVAAGAVPVSPARRAARAASIGVGGWLALAAGAAATAAASAWLIDRAASEPAPVPGIEAPLIQDVRAQPAPGIEAVIPHITAPEGSDAASWTPGDGAPAPDRTPVQVTPRDSADGPGSAGAMSSSGSTAPGQEQSPGGAGPGTAPPAHGDLEVQVPLGELEDAVKDTVDGVLPDGPLQDTVSPVIHAVDVSGLASWVVDSLLCGAQAPVSVQASDNAGVTEASLRVTTATGHTQRIALGAGGGLWSGALAPITGLQLGLLDPLVEVRVEVRDAAGNVATAHREVSVGIGSCLLG